MTIHKATQFAVDSHGAYVTELTDDSGVQILSTRQKRGEKLRGGSHVCYPYFGPDTAGVLPQHGFGRQVQWQVEVGVGARYVRCEHHELEDELFKGLHATISYELGEAGNSFHSKLVVENKSTQPRVVMPGFHPYFAIDPQDVQLNGQSVLLADFEPFQEFPDSPAMTLETGGRQITVHSSDLSHMVVWTDAGGAYLCIEPTTRGNGFSSREVSHSILGPGKSLEVSYLISW